jgi:hypothetical protein
MARRNFWDSFYRSWEQGDRIYDRLRGLQQRKEFADASKVDQVDESQYDAAQFQDEAEKQGGVWDAENQNFKLPDGTSVAPTNTPTWDESTKTYQNGMGQPLKPKAQFRLGDQTRDTRFTPEEVNEARSNRYADIYAKYGEIDKAQGVRANAQQMKLGKVQYEQAALQAKQAKNLDRIMKIKQQVDSGKLSEEEGVSALVDATDAMNDDGITHGYTAVGDGTYAITEMKNNKQVGAKTANFNDIVAASLKYASPQMFAQMQQQENWQANFNQNANQFDKNYDLNQRKFDREGVQWDAEMKQKNDQFITGLDFKMAEHNDDLQMDRERLGVTDNYYKGILDSYTNGTRGGGGRGGLGTPIGGNDKGIIYNTPEGLQIRPYPEGVTRDDIFPKTSGERPPRENTKALETFYDFVKNNPDAPTAQLEKVKRDLGLAEPLKFGPPRGKTEAPAKAGGLSPRAKVGFREAVMSMSPEEIEEKMANPLFNGVPITGEDQLYAAKLINGLRAGQKTTPGYLR